MQELKRENFHLSIYFQKNQSFGVTYSVDGKRTMVSLCEIDSEGEFDIDNEIYSLIYDEKDKGFTKTSRLGPYGAQDMLEGKYPPEMLIPDELYDAIVTDKILPCYGIKRNAKFESFPNMAKQVKWRGKGGFGRITTDVIMGLKGYLKK